MAMKIKYDVVSLDRILQFWKDRYEPAEGKVSPPIEHFLDPVRGKVVFKIFVETPDIKEETPNIKEEK